MNLTEEENHKKYLDRITPITDRWSCCSGKILWNTAELQYNVHPMWRSFTFTLIFYVYIFCITA
jgi:hypothetical protein